MLASILLLACSADLELNDNTGIIAEDAPLEASVAQLYRIGSSFDFRIVTEDLGRSGWTMVSDDPSVLTLEEISWGDEDSPTATIPAHAVGEGETTVRILNAFGDLIGSAPVEVAIPDVVALANEGESVPSSFTIIDHELVTFDLLFMRGTDPLAGSGRITADVARSGANADDARAGLSAKIYDDPSYQHLTLRGDERSEQTISLYSDEWLLGTLNVRVVDAQDVAEIAVAADDEAGAIAGDNLSVSAEALTEDGSRVYGAPIAITENGDLLFTNAGNYSYAFVPDQETEVGISFGDKQTTVVVHGVFASEFGDCACAVANVGPIGSAIALAMLGAAKRKRSGK